MKKYFEDKIKYHETMLARDNTVHMDQYHIGCHAALIAAQSHYNAIHKEPLNTLLEASECFLSDYNEKSIEQHTYALKDLTAQNNTLTRQLNDFKIEHECLKDKYKEILFRAQDWENKYGDLYNEIEELYLKYSL